MLGAALVATSLPAQTLSQQGFLEWRGWHYPRPAPGDSGAWVGDLRLRWDAGLKLNDRFRLSLGADGYFDTHRQGRRDGGFFWFDHSVRRPAAALRQASVTYLRGAWRLEAGKQFIRWGQTEFYSPTDRFAPRDFIEPLESETLPVTAFRVLYSRGAGGLDAVFAPRLTPSRLPIPLQRWLQVPPERSGTWSVRDVGTEFPGGTQWGLRYHHTGHRLEWSASWFDGYQHTPNVSLLVNPFANTIKLWRRHPRIRMLGADAAIPLGAWTLRAEAASFHSHNPLADEYVQYVGEAEWVGQQWGFAAAYSGETILAERLFRRLSPDRVFARVATARLSYAPTSRQEILAEALSRDDASGWGARLSYARSFGLRWRLTLVGTYLGGDPATIIGRYADNRSFSVRLRYRF